MTRRDFELIAATIASLPIGGGRSFTTLHRHVIAEQFADRLAGTNPRFNRARFLRACEVERSSI